MDSFLTFIEDEALESLDIFRIPLEFHTDSFFRARKQLDIIADLSKKSKGVGKVEGEEVESPTATIEMIVEEEKEEIKEEEEEVGEEREAPKIRKSK